MARETPRGLGRELPPHSPARRLGQTGPLPPAGAAPGPAPATTCPRWGRVDLLERPARGPLGGPRPPQGPAPVRVEETCSRAFGPPPTNSMNPGESRHFPKREFPPLAGYLHLTVPASQSTFQK